MARKAYTTLSIRYAHVPKTPIYNGTTKRWEYVASPGASQLNASASQMQAIDANATEAKAVAASKATPNEAVEEVKAQMFEVEDTAGKALVPLNFKLIETSDGWQMSFCVRKALGTGTNPAYCLNLAYATQTALSALAARVTALERKAGL